MVNQELFKVRLLYIMWCLLVTINDSIYKHCTLFFSKIISIVQSEAHIFDDQALGILILVLPSTYWVATDKIIVFVSFLGCKVEPGLFHGLKHDKYNILTTAFLSSEVSKSNWKVCIDFCLFPDMEKSYV